MMEDFECDCGHRLIYKSQHDRMVRFSVKVLKMKNDGTGVVAVCKSCGVEKTLPVSIHSMPRTETLQKSIESETTGEQVPQSEETPKKKTRRLVVLTKENT